MCVQVRASVCVLVRGDLDELLIVLHTPLVHLAHRLGTCLLAILRRLFLGGRYLQLERAKTSRAASARLRL